MQKWLFIHTKHTGIPTWYGTMKGGSVRPGTISGAVASSEAGEARHHVTRAPLLHVDLLLDLEGLRLHYAYADALRVEGGERHPLARRRVPSAVRPV